MCLLTAGAIAIVTAAGSRAKARLALAAGIGLTAAALAVGLGLWEGPRDWRYRQESSFERAARTDEVHPLAYGLGPRIPVPDLWTWNCPPPAEGRAIVARTDLQSSAWMLLPAALTLVSVGVWPRRCKSNP